MGRNGSIDWLCLPRFDSSACFAALLGDGRNGHWQIAPRDPEARVERRYRGHSLVLDTLFTTGDGGIARLVDCMPPRGPAPDLVRVVEGVQGEVEFEMELVIRFDYGSIVPWVRNVEGVLRAIGGPDALSVWSPVELRGVDLTTRASFKVRAGERLPFVLDLASLARSRAARHRRPRCRRRHLPMVGTTGRCSAHTRGPGATPCCARSSCSRP